MADPKIPRGYERQSKDILELSEGVAPVINIRMAPWLPIVEQNRRSEFDIAIKAGSVLAIEYFSTAVGNISVGHYFVPANGGKAMTPSYSALDVGYVLNRADGEALETGDLPATYTLPANNPVGYAFFDFYHDQEQVYNNMQLQTYEKTAVRQYFIEVPVKYEYQLGTPGELVMADWEVAGSWRPVDSTYYTGADRYTAGADTIAVAEHLNLHTQVIGRLWSVEKISDIDNLAYETTMPGLSLTGSGSDGVPAHLRNAETLNGSEWRAKIMINT